MPQATRFRERGIGCPGIAARTAQRVALFPCPLAACSPLATPHEGRRVGVPAPYFRRQPGHQLGAGLRMVTLQRPPRENALHRLGQVQPGATQRRVERHDAVLEQPAAQVPRTCGP